MRKPRFRVEYEPPDGDPVEYVVTVRHGDELRAELAAGQNGIRVNDMPFHLTSLWVWAASIREGHVPEQKWQEWRTRVAHIDKDPDEPEGALDPTRPAELTNGLSPLLATSATSTAGSTPTPTPG